MSFNLMPPEILLIIITHKNIPLQKRIQLRSVNSQWLPAIEGHLKKMTTLAVYSSRRDGGRGQSNSDLVVPKDKFGANFVRQITRLFPALGELLVEIATKRSYEQLPKLLTSYRYTLTKLSLIGFSLGENSKDNMNKIAATRPLATALNELTNLTRLELSDCITSRRFFRKLAPTLSRLEYFSLKTLHTIKTMDIGPVIFNRLSNRCNNLEMPSFCFLWSTTNLDASLTHLVVTGDFIEDLLTRICGKFRALQSLVFDFDGYPMDTSDFLGLARLPNLTELKLLNVDYQHSHLTAANPSENRLRSVKHFTIKLYSYHHGADKMFARKFANSLCGWFPALEMITVQYQSPNYRFIRLMLKMQPFPFKIHLEPYWEHIGRH